MGLLEKLNFTGCRIVGGIPIDLISFSTGLIAGLYQNTGTGLAASFLPAVLPVAGLPRQVEDSYDNLLREKRTLEKYGKLDQETLQQIDKDLEHFGSSRVYNGAVASGFKGGGISILETSLGYGLGYAVSALVVQ